MVVLFELLYKIKTCGENQTLLNIEDAYEGVEVWINEEYIGMKICPPYTFDITKAVQTGKNHVRIEVANTLFNRVQALNGAGGSPMRGGPSVIAPSGIVGKVSVVAK